MTETSTIQIAPSNFSPPRPQLATSRKQSILADIERLKRERPLDLPSLPDQLSDPNATPTDNQSSQEPEPPGFEAVRELLFLPEIEDVVDFLAKPIKRPKVLIDGLLNKGSKMMFSSGSKCYKTWTTLDLAFSIASGVPWLGFDVTKGKVLYVNLELQPYEIQKRLAKIKRARGLELEKGALEVWNLRGHAASYDKIIPKIIERVKTREYDMIIIDPIYKLYGDTDENSAGDVAKLMNEFEKLAVRTGAAVVFAAHYSKGNQAGKESIDRTSGSGVFGRDPDTILAFSKHEDDNAFTVEAELREFKRMEPFVVKWEEPVMVRDTTLNPAKLKTAISKQPLYNIEQLLAPLATEKLTKKELKTAVMTGTGMGETTFNNLFTKAIKTEGVSIEPSTGKISYSKPTQARSV